MSDSPPKKHVQSQSYLGLRHFRGWKLRPRICWADNLNVLDRSDWKLCEAIPAGPGVAPQNLFRKLESLGDFRCGTISVNYRKCGKSKCGCARKDHPGRGPQYLWNVSIGGKTQARNLPVGPEPEKTEREVERYRTFIRLSQETGRGQRADLSVAPGPHRLQSFCTLPRGVVRVVQEHQLRPLRDLLLDRAEVRHEPELWRQRHQHRLRARQPRPAGVDRISRIGSARVVARVQSAEVGVEDRLLRPERRHDLAVRVQPHVEPPLVEVPDRAPEILAPAVARVSVRFRLAHRLLHRLHDQRRRRAVGIADAEADHVHALLALARDLALQLGERVRRNPLQSLTRSHPVPPALLRARRSGGPHTPAAPTPSGSRADPSPPRPPARPRRARPSPQPAKRAHCLAGCIPGRAPPPPPWHLCPRTASPPHRARISVRGCGRACRRRPRCTTTRWCGSGTSDPLLSLGRSRPGRVPRASPRSQRELRIEGFRSTRAGTPIFGLPPSRHPAHPRDRRENPSTSGSPCPYPPCTCPVP